MATWKFRGTTASRILILVAAIAAARCSGGGESGGGSGQPPPPPPPIDPAKFQIALGGYGDEGARFVAATDRGGALIVGYTDSSGAGDRDVWIVETDELGTVLRERTLGGTTFDEPVAAGRAHDGDVIVAGSSSDGTAATVRLDADWTERWRRPGAIAGLRVLADGDVAVIRAAQPPAEPVGAVLARLDPTGEAKWSVSLGDALPYAASMPIAEGPDGDLYVLAGLAVARLDATGNLRWAKQLDSVPRALPAELRTLVVGDDGSVAAGGRTFEFVGRSTYSTALVAGFSSDGAATSARELSGIHSSLVTSMVSGTGGEMELLGDHSLLRVSADGDVLREIELPFAPAALAPTPGGHWIAGQTEDHGRGQGDVLLAKLDGDDQLGAPPAPEVLPAATTFGAVEAIADLGEESAPLSLRATSDASSAPMVAWSSDPHYTYTAAIETARRAGKGRWDRFRLAPDGQGGSILALTAAGSGRALASWTAPYSNPILATDFDPRRGWTSSFTRLDSDLGSFGSGGLAGLAANTRGDGTALWIQYAFGTKALAARRFDLATRSFGPPVTLPGTLTTDPVEAALALDDDGRATALYAVGSEIRAFAGEPDGTWWSVAPIVTHEPVAVLLPLVSNGGADELARWTNGYGGPRGLRVCWLRDGVALGSPTTLDPDPYPAPDDHAMALDRDGHALGVWVTDYTIFASDSTPGAAWSTPVAHPDEAALGAVLAGVAPLGHGEFLVSWFERRGARGTAWATRYHVGGTWGPAEFLGDALGGYVTQTAGTVVWLAPTNPGTALVARTAK